MNNWHELEPEIARIAARLTPDEMLQQDLAQEMRIDIWRAPEGKPKGWYLHSARWSAVKFMTRTAIDCPDGDLDRQMIQTLMYLKLSVAGHLTVFVARTKGHFWSVKPSRSLLFAVIATQIVATFIVVYGFLLPAMGWELALFVWGYALVWFLVSDRVKLFAYRVFDPSAEPLLVTKPVDRTPQIATRA